tara:strand:+ start:741 stop:1634 length:894 start_codon:yes stop_codon:yes gene_type:complete
MNDLIIQQFYEYLHKFLNELGKSSKKLKKIIDEKYTDVCEKKYIDTIKSNLYNHKTQFLGKESELDEFFKNNSIELLEDINISDIWAKSAKDNKSAIIQYIKVFVFMFESSNKDADTSSEDENENENEKESEENSSDNNFEDMLKKSLLEEDDNMKSFYENINKNQDNSILNLAKNIAGELRDDNEGGLENVMDMFKNGDGLNSLVSKITSKLDSRIKSGDIDQSQLLNDAQKMMSGNNNLFGNMFNNLNKNNMFNQPNSQQSNDVNDVNDVKNVKIEEVDEGKKKPKKNKKQKSKK